MGIKTINLTLSSVTSMSSFFNDKIQNEFKSTCIRTKVNKICSVEVIDTLYNCREKHKIIVIIDTNAKEQRISSSFQRLINIFQFFC